MSIGTQDADQPERFSGDWWQDVLLGNPLKIIILVFIAGVTRYVVHRAIDRVVARMSVSEPPKRMFGSKRAAHIVVAGTGVYSERRALRARTIGSLLKSIVTGVIGAIVVVMTLDIIGYDIGPLIASAGIAGIALGFGAQNLVKDFISGLAMLLEDQYGVGDVIDMGEASGTVEAVGMRVTRLRATDGTVWYVRNGEVVRIGNSSQDWARAIVDVRVAYGEDVDRVRDLLERTAQALADDAEWAPKIIEAPEVSGVESLATDAVVMRVMVKTGPQEQWGVARELRERIKDTFDAEGVKIPQTPTLPPPPAR
ncbi:MAG: mechanosensitive ion channel family protein [Jiangellaceae bacterium]